MIHCNEPQGVVCNHYKNADGTYAILQLQYRFPLVYDDNDDR